MAKAGGKGGSKNAAQAELNELERSWRETASPAAGLEFARERVQSGDRLEDLPADLGALWLTHQLEEGELTEDQVRLAAYCGLKAARGALGEDSPEEIDDPERIGEWAEGLKAWGTPVVFQAALSTARTVAARLEKLHDDEDDAIPALVEAFDAWFATPDARRADAVQRTAEVLRGWDEEDEEADDGLRAVDLIAEAVAAAQRGEPVDSVAFSVSDALQSAVQAVSPKRLMTSARRTVLAHALRPPAAAKVRKKKARAYSPKEKFSGGEVIEHTKFGKGTVEAVTPKQIEVEFEDGTRRKLIHGL